MPQDRMCKVFGDEFIQKCAVSVEEIDFGSLQDKTKNKTFILYKLFLNIQTKGGATNGRKR